MRSILRAILTAVLLLGGGVGDWLPAPAEAHENCCCGIPASIEDTCPCPKPEGNRGPQGGCSERAPQTALATQAAPRRQAPATPRLEPSPAPPALGAEATPSGAARSGGFIGRQGRDPDLGRHLASLRFLRI